MTVRLETDALVHDPQSVVTVGTFDGVHCGHQGIITRMKEQVVGQAGRLVVVTFDPHPQIVLQKPDKKPVRLLTTLDERLAVFERMGVDLAVVIPFTREFAATSPEMFVRQVLVRGIGARTVFVGHDHMFGKDRTGNEELLRELGSELNFSVVPVPPLECDGVVVSSTKIRESLYAHDVAHANQMLGWKYQITGVVVRGDGRGRTIGVPTANVMPLHPFKLLPGNGVYVVTATVNHIEYPAVANIGTRPTFTTDQSATLEVHLLDSDLDLYDQELTVTFQQFLRTEQRFDSKESLVAQLHTDIQQAHTFFQTHFSRTDS